MELSNTTLQFSKTNTAKPKLTCTWSLQFMVYLPRSIPQNNSPRKHSEPNPGSAFHGLRSNSLQRRHQQAASRQALVKHKHRRRQHRALRRIRPAEDVHRSGNRAGGIQYPKEYKEKYGGGYMAPAEIIYHVHCLNFLRKATIYNHEYYKDDPVFADPDLAANIRLGTRSCSSADQTNQEGRNR